MKTFKTIFFIAVLLIISAITAVTAQVTVGAGDPPSPFSVLELISGGNKGMRLPQLTTPQRNALEATADFQSEKTGKAMGLQIFNITEQCLEYWNGNRWISMCNDVPPYIGPKIITPASFYCNQTVADLLACVTVDAGYTVKIYNSASVLITVMTTPLVKRAQPQAATAATLILTSGSSAATTAALSGARGAMLRAAQAQQSKTILRLF